MTEDAPSKAVIELVARRLTPEQQALAVSAMTVVRRVAARVHRKWPHADLNELVSIGHLVMVTQLPNWEPERGPLDAFIFTWTRFAMQKQLHPRASTQALERGATLLEPLRDPVELAADPVEELIGRTEAQERAELSADLRVQAIGLAMHTLADPATGEDDTIAELDLARGRAALDRLVATLDGDMQ